MESVIELLRQTDARLSGSDIGLGLPDVITAAEGEADPIAAVDSVTTLLRERATRLKQAASEIARLRTRVDQLKENFPLTAEGWPARRSEIESILRAAPSDGLASWLDEWFRAASLYRLDALERTVEVDGLPEGTDILVQRCKTAAAAMNDRWWPVCEPVLAAGARGVTVAGRTVPQEATRLELRLLLVRIAVEHRPVDEAAAGLNSISNDFPAVDLAALRSRLARREGRHDEADIWLAQASIQGPENPDVALEVIAKARNDGLEGLGIDAARTAINAVTLLSDVGPLLERLVVPTPAEMLIALAERALDEQAIDLHLDAIEAASIMLPEGESTLAALVAELTARSARERGLAESEQVEALLDAGVARAVAGQFDAARAHFEGVLEVDASNSEAKLRLADCLVALGNPRPLTEGRPLIDRALRLIDEVSERGAISTDMSWTYLVAAGAHGRLADAVDATAGEHAWRRFVAAARAVAHDLESATRWVELADSADRLDLYLVAHALAAQAERLDPDDPTVAEQMTQELVNAGHLERALADLEGHTEPFDQAVRAFLLVRLGHPLEAIRELGTTTPNPAWPWASETLMAAFVLTDRFEEARVEANRIGQLWADRLDEAQARSTLAWAEMVTGDFDAALSKIKPLVPGDRASDAASLAGRLMLLAGQEEAGRETIRSWLETTTNRLAVSDWQNLDAPVLRKLAVRHGATLATLDDLDRLAEQRTVELASKRDALAELGNAGHPDAADRTVAQAKALVTALLLINDDAPERAVAALEGSALEFPDDPELAALLTAARDRTTALSPGPGSAVGETAVRAVSAALDGDAAAALRGLRSLLDHGLQTASTALKEAADENRGVLAQVAESVQLLLTDPEYRDEAAGLLKSLGTPPDVPRPLAVELPPSWFEGHDDPVNDHSLFLRYLPEVRLRAPFELPAINVNVDPDLEPSGYRISIHGEVKDTGTVPREFLYGSSAAIDLLDARAVSEPAEELGLLRLPTERVAQPALADLLVMPALDVVARRVGDIAGTQVHAESSEPQSPTDGTRVLG
jgi:tetratricopeptide (TPR) repeat protein